jgi:hypothetical protein
MVDLQTQPGGIPFFDRSPEIHEAHLLAYVNLLDLILFASEGLANTLCGRPSQDQPIRQPFAEVARSRVDTLTIRNSLTKKIMEELGLWQF